MSVPVHDFEVYKGEDWSATYQHGGSPQRIVSSTNASPIVMTVTQHGFANGNKVRVYGHNSNKAAIGNWTIANVTGNTFDLAGSGGSGFGGSDGFVVPCIDATGASIVCSWNDKSVAGSAVLTPTQTWVDRSICRFTLSLTDAQISTLTQDRLYYRMFFRDSLGIDTLLLTGTVKIQTP